MKPVSLGEIAGRVSAIEAAVTNLIIASPSREDVQELLRRQSEAVLADLANSSEPLAQSMAAGWSESIARFLVDPEV